MSLQRSITTFSGLTLISRFLGFARDILIATFLGATLVSDAFFVAFKLPNFFRRLFAEGAFSAAFVPIFVGLLGSGDEKEKRKAAERFAEDSLAVLFSILLVFTVLVQVAMPWLMLILAPGFKDDPEKFTLTIEFARITFPYLLLISLVALVSGVLNGLGRFAVGAAAPIFMNLILLASLGLFHDDLFITGRALAYAVTTAGIIQLGWMLWGLKKAGFRPRLRMPKLTPRVRELGHVMLPVILGAGVMQVNLVVDIILASFLPDGSLSFLYYADRLNQLPIGVVGVAVGTVLLPALSRALDAGDLKRVVFDQNRAMEAALLFTLPAAFALAVIPAPLITVLFEHGEFDAFDTIATANALTAYAVGLPAYVLVKVLTPAYYSRKDTKTPVKFAMISVSANVVLNLILMQFLAHVGLALATALASWLNVTLLYRGLKGLEHFHMDARLRARTLRMVLASTLMAIAVWGLAQALSPYLTGRTLESLPSLLALLGGGVVTYVLFARLAGAFTWAEVEALITHKDRTSRG